ncbi:uncharacterized protein LOC131643564 [Vicia villosa]|uniref:uncharacterized protein LOC131643564 n=1 Tax=Vicia villosa TaxID=3911 RepID=UPI00273B2A8E|nr:uncharacterized protein LOC131643564 [Vicia villosa]
MEYLYRVLQSLKDSSDFRFHLKCAKLRIINICFADDILLFSRADFPSIKLIRSKIRDFTQATCLQMSQPKSKLYFGGVDIPNQNLLMQDMGFQIGKLPFKYLGVSLDSKKLTIPNCQPLIDKMICRFSHWCTRLLSYAGRLQLVKSILFAIDNYWLQIFPLPKKILAHVESLCRRFLWTGQDTDSMKAPISWEHVCDPVVVGGLNVIALGV